MRSVPWYSRLIAALLVAMFGAQIAWSFEASSTNFRIQNYTVNSFGAYSTSSSFSSVTAEDEIETDEATSTNFILQMGVLRFDGFTPKSEDWRWYDDETNMTPTTPLAAENTAPIDVEDLNIIKLRILVRETSAVGATSTKFKLQFSTSSDFSVNVHPVQESVVCSGSSKWCYANGAGVDGVKISSKVLTNSDACAGSVGNGCGTHNESGTTTTTVYHPAGAAAEYEFTMQPSGAALNTVYYFRLVDTVASSTVPLNTGEVYPSLLTGGATLAFAIEGVSAGTATEGVSTDITTTSMGVEFGSLPLNVSLKGAQRLRVSTNGTGGYKVYTFQRQQLLNELSDEIDPVTATNPAPAGWTTGCTGGAVGCFGYHSGEDVLEGGSTRFAANDTYARFETTPYEIAYNSGPANNKTTDMVYQIEVKDGQEDGNYSTNIVYIVTPVF